MTAPETHPVTEADRRAYLRFNGMSEQLAASVLAGQWDRTTGMQILAGHRIEAQAELQPAIEALQAIEDGEGDHQEIARQTLAELGVPTLEEGRKA